MSDTITDAWSLTWQGRTWTNRDLTGEHAAAVGEMLGMSPTWDWFDMTELHPALGPLQVMALIAAFVVVDDGVQGTAARIRVLDAIKGATVDDLLEAINLS
jgi:hypothetical protein